MNDILKQQIRNAPRQCITYAAYMNTVLYHPQCGYYMKEREKIGRSGDFLTTSHYSPVFGKVMARLFARLVEEEIVAPQICEIGGGDGAFFKAVLDEWKEVSPHTYDALHYHVIEKSPDQRERAKDGRVQFHDHLMAFFDHRSFHGIIFSNEWFDALPVHVVQKLDGALYEVFVSMTEQDELIEVYHPLANEEIAEYMEVYDVMLSEQQRIEIPLVMLEMITYLAEHTERAMVFTFDYGYVKEEWETPERHSGSLRGYFKHQLVDDPLKHPGDMDLTSHIPFHTLIEKGNEEGLQLVDFLRQDQFLAEAGLLKLLVPTVNPDPFSRESKQNRAVRQLVMDGGISSYFHVCLQQKGLSLTSEEWKNLLHQ